MRKRKRNYTIFDQMFNAKINNCSLTENFSQRNKITKAIQTKKRRNKTK